MTHSSEKIDESLEITTVIDDRDVKAEKEFDEACATYGGFDGYHVEDVVGLAMMFRAHRDKARATIKELESALERADADIDRLWRQIERDSE
jgi:hypothetical protein